MAKWLSRFTGGITPEPAVRAVRTRTAHQAPDPAEPPLPPGRKTGEQT